QWQVGELQRRCVKSCVDEIGRSGRLLASREPRNGAHALFCDSSALFGGCLNTNPSQSARTARPASQTRSTQFYGRSTAEGAITAASPWAEVPICSWTGGSITVARGESGGGAGRSLQCRAPSDRSAWTSNASNRSNSPALR